jgi:rod shape-determining protein MreD
MSTAQFSARVALLVLSAAVAQVGLFSQLPLAGVRLPVLLLVAVAAGIGLGSERGAVVGVAAGLAYDLLLTTPLGLCAGVFAVTAHVAGRLRPGTRRPGWWRVPALVGGASAAAYLAVVVGARLMAGRPLAPGRLVVSLVVVAAAHALAGPVAVRVLRWSGGGPGRPALHLVGHGR